MNPCIFWLQRHTLTHAHIRQVQSRMRRARYTEPTTATRRPGDILGCTRPADDQETTKQSNKKMYGCNMNKHNIPRPSPRTSCARPGNAVWHLLQLVPGFWLPRGELVDDCLPQFAFTCFCCCALRLCFDIHCFEYLSSFILPSILPFFLPRIVLRFCFLAIIETSDPYMFASCMTHIMIHMHWQHFF